MYNARKLSSVPLLYYVRQRSTWISIAHEIPGTEVWILHFNTPFEVRGYGSSSHINNSRGELRNTASDALLFSLLQVCEDRLRTSEFRSVLSSLCPVGAYTSVMIERLRFP